MWTRIPIPALWSQVPDVMTRCSIYMSENIDYVGQQAVPQLLTCWKDWRASSEALLAGNESPDGPVWIGLGCEGGTMLGAPLCTVMPWG